MRKALIILFALIANYYTYSQSWTFEEKNISKKLLNKSLDQEEIKLLVSDWRSFKAEYGDYPDLPFNERNEIEYNFVFENKLSKEIIYNRVLEWSAISFGSLESVLHYKNLESGKIILKGSFSVVYKADFLKSLWSEKIEERLTSSKSNQTYIFTIIDNKIKIQVVNVKIATEYGGYLNANSYIQSETFTSPISSYYPISNYSMVNWKKQLNLLYEVSTNIKSTAKNFNWYINAYNDDYLF